MSSTLRRATPLKSVEELLAWRPAEGDVRPCSTRAASRINHNDALPVLVCHDMKGGYLEDAAVDGVHGPMAIADGGHLPYRHRHFDYIDDFVYFSHERVTIPPPSWIAACHVNGVRCLGTFITEWDAGARDNLALLASADRVAAQLATMAEHYGFDGWLVNIECKLAGPAKAQAMATFLGALRRDVAQRTGGQGRVIWYDSITIDGSLAWQNCLNDRNSLFFDQCDAFFTNYVWKPDQPLSSAEYAGERARDVLVGIDVFGRNCPYEGATTGDGVRYCHNSGVGVAIFAPGWAHESQGAARFDQLDAAVWTDIRKQRADRLPLLTVHQGALGTTFGQGAGHSFALSGETISRAPWFNLALTSPSAGNTGVVRSDDAAFFGASYIVANSGTHLLSAHLPTNGATGVRVIVVLKSSAAFTEAPPTLCVDGADEITWVSVTQHGQWAAHMWSLAWAVQRQPFTVRLQSDDVMHVGAVSVVVPLLCGFELVDGVTCRAADEKRMLADYYVEQKEENADGTISATIGFTHRLNHHGGIVVVRRGDELLGATRESSFRVCNIPRNSTISLTPVIMNGSLVDVHGPLEIVI